jgi:Alpha-amylase, domain C
VGLNGQSSKRNVPPYKVTVQGAKYAKGTRLVEVLSCEGTVAGQGEVTVTMSGGRPVVYFPKMMLDGSGICGL